MQRLSDTFDEVVVTNKENDERVKEYDELRKRYVNLVQENVTLKENRADEELENRLFLIGRQRDLDKGQRAQSAKSRMLKLELESWKSQAEIKEAECGELTEIIERRLNNDRS